MRAVAAEPGGQVVTGAGPLIGAADPEAVLDRQRRGIDLLHQIGGMAAAQAARNCSNAPHSQRIRRLTSDW